MKRQMNTQVLKNDNFPRIFIAFLPPWQGGIIILCTINVDLIHICIALLFFGAACLLCSPGVQLIRDAYYRHVEITKRKCVSLLWFTLLFKLMCV